MSIIQELRETVNQGGPAAGLANELLKISDDYAKGDLSKEEYEFLINEIADVRAAQELANDELACRFIINAVKLIAA